MIGLLYRAADALRRRILKDDHGRIGEDLAHRYLRERGCTVVARRYRPPAGGGEIDLVVWQGETLVFVEVKTRATGAFGPPDRSVDAEKQEYLAAAGRDYARRAGVEWKRVRFDIVGIILTRPPRIEWLRDAFRPRRAERTPALDQPSRSWPLAPVSCLSTSPARRNSPTRSPLSPPRHAPPPR